MKKISDLEKEEQTREWRHIESKAGLLGTDWDGHLPNRLDKDEFGLCSNCTHARVTKTKYGNIYMFCTEWERHLNGVNLVSECTAYHKIGQMSLFDMKEIAVMIDVENKKIGF